MKHILSPAAMAIALVVALSDCFAQTPTTGTEQAAGAVERADYLVLVAVPPADPFHAVARHLADGRRGRCLEFRPDDLEAVRGILAETAPRYVALVMRPDQLDFAFARRFLQLATEIDDDPFVDFAYGYITGRDVADARSLVDRGLARRPKSGESRLAEVVGGVDRSGVSRRHEDLGGRAVPLVRIASAGARAFPETGRDRDFLLANLPDLTGADVVTFIGHGYPREVVGGPTAAELAELRLDDAVVLNVACYTGVTGRFFEDDYRERRRAAKEVAADESFGLALLHTGVVGYTAYLCPRPAGPELATDLAALVVDGISLGEARRRDYDKTVLGYLGFGEERLSLRPVRAEDDLPTPKDPVRDLMLEGATGGVLFGDPAAVPFAGTPDRPVVEVRTESIDGGFEVHAEADFHGVALHCSDPTARMGQTMALKVYARLPLGDQHVREVDAGEMTLAGRPVRTRVVWAVEHDHGARFLQVKINGQRPQAGLGTLAASVRVHTTSDPSQASARGIVEGPDVASSQQREADPPPGAAPGTRVGVTAGMLVRARLRKVSRPALDAALTASDEALRHAGATAARDGLRRFGSEGFRAVCVLLDVGVTHYRTWTLLGATWQPGDEDLLVDLAEADPLPNFGTWQVLEGLGVADTPRVRTYLLERLDRETDAGFFMAASMGLAHLRETEAAARIGARVREFRPGWSGVEPHLLVALEMIGGAQAVAELEQIAAHEEAKASVLDALERLDPEAARRVRARRKK
ncbi:MAG: hypothetical protein R3F56_13320 [Planctomycetota bacterium]